MKKYLLKIVLFFALAAMMDVAFGYVFKYLRSHAKSGVTEKCEYIANRSKDDIIILGSSRAVHHYVPQVIEDSLGMSCYNCGQEGNGVVLAYGRFKMLTSRYKPKLIIYEVTPDFDYGNIDPNSKYLSYLRPYYDKSEIKNIISVFDDEYSSLKMQSRMYQNTAKILSNIRDLYGTVDKHKGYAPIYGKMSPYNSKKHTIIDNYEVDSLKLSYMEKLIVEAQSMDVPLIFMVSPRYEDIDYFSACTPAMELCQKHNVTFCNFIDCESVSKTIEYFQDNGHLNNQGAVKYSSIVIEAIRNSLITE